MIGRMLEVAAYIADQPETARNLLERLHAEVVRLIPNLEEGVSYGMPALLYRGKGLVAVMVTKAGYSVYPFSGRVVTELLPQLGGFATSKGTVRFTNEHPLSPALFEAIVLARRDEIDKALGGS